MNMLRRLSLLLCATLQLCVSQHLLAVTGDEDGDGANATPTTNEELPTVDITVAQQQADAIVRNSNRYIIKFTNTTENLDKARRMESRALEGQLVMMLPEENAEVMILNTEEEVRQCNDRPDVEYCELGEKTTFDK